MEAIVAQHQLENKGDVRYILGNAEGTNQGTV